MEKSFPVYPDREAASLEPCEDRREKPQRRRKRPQGPVSSVKEKHCSKCRATNTPVWRWGGAQKDILLCNACFLRRKRLGPKSSKGSPGLPKARKHAVRQIEQQEFLEDTSMDEIAPLVFSEEDGSQMSQVPDLDDCPSTSSSQSSFSRERLAGFMMQEKARLEGHLFPTAESDSYHHWDSPTDLMHMPPPPRPPFKFAMGVPIGEWSSQGGMNLPHENWNQSRGERLQPECACPSCNRNSYSTHSSGSTGSKLRSWPAPVSISHLQHIIEEDPWDIFSQEFDF